MKLYLLLCACISVTLFAEEAQTLSPRGGVTDTISSLESAYPNEVDILRTIEPYSGIVSYVVRVYAPEVMDAKSLASQWQLAIVVCDEKGIQLVSAPLADYGLWSTRPPSTEKFRAFEFSVHESVEKNTCINIGRRVGIRILFTRYRLPLKSIDLPKAHK